MLKYLIIFMLSIMFITCRYKQLDNCEGEYAFIRPYQTSHPCGRVQLGESIKFLVGLPVKHIIIGG